MMKLSILYHTVPVCPGWGIWFPWNNLGLNEQYPMFKFTRKLLSSMTNICKYF